MGDLSVHGGDGGTTANRGPKVAEDCNGVLIVSRAESEEGWGEFRDVLIAKVMRTDSQ